MQHDLDDSHTTANYMLHTAVCDLSLLHESCIWRLTALLSVLLAALPSFSLLLHISDSFCYANIISY